MPAASKLHRRTLLRGAFAGSAVGIGLPTLGAMLNTNGTAYASGKPLPRRMGVFFWGNGVRHKRWIPEKRGAQWELSDELAPLAKVKPYINVVTGMNVKTGNEQGHHAGTVGIMSGCPMVSQPHPSAAYASTFSAPSIDQVAAEVIGKGTPFKSLEVGVCRDVTENEGTTLLYLSHRGPDAPNPPEYDPARLFDRLFGGNSALSAASPLGAPRDIGKSVLDVVAADARALAGKLGNDDRRRIDQHLASIRDLELRLAPPSKRVAACKVPERPSPFVVQGGNAPHAEINRAMADLVTLSLSCDLTRVFTFMFAGSVGETVYWEVGQDKSHHQFSHDEPGDQPLVHAATVFIMEQYAYLLERMKATPDGAGNLLDSSVVLASSDTASGQAHSLEDYPIVLAGRGSGALKYPGVHYRSDKGENTTKVLLSMLRATGLRLPKFGKKGGEVDDGLGAIEA
ncbi:MAG TPA: DUF1552 domain-containing protein [Polyangia bacterium]